MIKIFTLLPAGNKTADVVPRSSCGKVFLHSYNSSPILTGFFHTAVWAPLPFSCSLTLLQLLSTALAIFPKLVIHLPAFISWSDIWSQACGHTFALVFTSSLCTAYTYSALLSPSLRLLSKAFICTSFSHSFFYVLLSLLLHYNISC